ncbi:hypothetical protein HC931_07895 [Candidatus Gracilibacteria bacterium]|nr:hypothetical protein [Candidatus Gracilibacteria bacterium]
MTNELIYAISGSTVAIIGVLGGAITYLQVRKTLNQKEGEFFSKQDKLEQEKQKLLDSLTQSENLQKVLGEKNIQLESQIGELDKNTSQLQKTIAVLEKNKSSLETDKKHEQEKD